MMSNLKVGAVVIKMIKGANNLPHTFFFFGVIPLQIIINDKHWPHVFSPFGLKLPPSPLAARMFLFGRNRFLFFGLLQKHDETISFFIITETYKQIEKNWQIQAPTL